MSRPESSLSVFDQHAQLLDDLVLFFEREEFVDFFFQFSKVAGGLLRHKNGRIFGVLGFVVEQELLVELFAFVEAGEHDLVLALARETEHLRARSTILTVRHVEDENLSTLAEARGLEHSWQASEMSMK